MDSRQDTLPEIEGDPLDLPTLRNHLWEAAGILRGSIDSADYKNYIFGLMFLKRLSDRFEEEADETISELIAEGVDDGTAEQVAYNDEDVHEFYIPDRARWGHLRTPSSGRIGPVTPDTIEQPTEAETWGYSGNVRSFVTRGGQAATLRFNQLSRTS